ncbi:MAG: hypothetical protein ACOX8T_11800 [Bacillota bacterium]|jgi:hypothetical protein
MKTAKTTFVNLTQHDINVLEPETTIPPSGTEARCAVSREQVAELGGITVNRTVFGDVDNLPAPQAGTYYIVSALVAQACPGRTDLLIVDEVERDEAGRIVGCRALATMRPDAFAAGDANLGRPIELKASEHTTAEQKALAEAVMSRVRQMGSELLASGAKSTALADVAARHGRLVPELPEGFDVESPCYCLSTGYNGKRPIYLIAGDGVFALARGTYFGRSSSFGLATSVYEVADLAERLLDKATMSRVIARANKAS